jgi:hypothetical protein
MTDTGHRKEAVPALQLREVGTVIAAVSRRHASVIVGVVTPENRGIRGTMQVDNLGAMFHGLDEFGRLIVGVIRDRIGAAIDSWSW